MNTNDISFNSASYSGVERIVVPDSSAKYKEAAASTASSSPLPIQTAKQLRQAELQGESVPISDEQLIRAIERSVKALQGAQTSLEFSVHDKTKQIMVKVLDKESGEVIREIPPEKTMDFVAKLWELAGILVDERR
ncbi:MAG: flagellar protein FlaG protein [Paenibacillaceae bacterium]|jgi:flagellar protein FlaG|nr:flagellar protein FlaG protein [Paenibacillaceae bacterium]